MRERLTEADLDGAERNLAWIGEPGSALDVAKRAIDEVRRLRGLVARLHRDDDAAPGLEEIHPSNEGRCPWCSGDVEPAPGPRHHAPSCPWTELEAEARAIEADKAQA